MSAGRTSALALLLALLACDRASPESSAPREGPPEPDAAVPVARCRRFDPERRPFFGDLHVHTALSLDANLQGTRARPADAYRFARGEELVLAPRAAGEAPRVLKLARPLDFVAISDHAEFLGLVTTCLTPGLAGYDSGVCEAYRARPESAFFTLNARLSAAPGDARHGVPCDPEHGGCGSATASAWSEIRAAARAADDESEECSFTSFVAYEWSASPGTKNLHRNVIFASDVVPELPFSYFEGSREEELWTALERDCLARAGCDVLTVPHNPNLSAGLMFESADRAGQPFDRAYADRRARFEPLVEIFQHKGSSECLPEMGPDELCRFELMPYNTLATAALGGAADTLLARDFVRDALARGLGLEQTLGRNPFAYGFVASTDTHTGTPGAVGEASFAGHGGAGLGSASTSPSPLPDSAWFNPGGLAVLWAEENSRSSLFAAMRRREAYATSGPRIVLRLFGGFGLRPDLCGSHDFVREGYGGGVPMGGDLRAAPQGAVLRLAAWALRDPGTATDPGSGLERVQIVKGWFEQGEPRYRVLDVAGAAEASGGDSVGCEDEPPGAAELCAVWSDPDFDPAQPAFYYARVLEAPSCRWDEHACARAGVDCSRPDALPEVHAACCRRTPVRHQERAWSSPIFYHPG